MDVNLPLDPTPAPAPAPATPAVSFWDRVHALLVWVWTRVIEPTLVAVAKAVAWVATRIYTQFQPVTVTSMGIIQGPELARSFATSTLVGIPVFVVFFVFHLALYIVPFALPNALLAALPVTLLTLVLDLMRRLNHGVDPAASISIFTESKSS